MAAFREIAYAVADGVCTVAMHRPEKKNALTRDMYLGLAEAIERGAADPGIRCLLLTGTPEVFCAGNDIGDFQKPRPAEDPKDPGPSHRFYFGLANFEKPVVAAVHGLAIGIGCTMLLHADIVYAAPEARFRLPFVDLGLVPELGASRLVPWLVAVAFLVSLFIARPSPFYILDEVEAALDDVNLGRLLDIYAELRENSQLLVITHQKRTMEIADALYGVTMRGDGVSTVISQRLRETASVA